MKKQSTLPNSSFEDAQARFRELRATINETAGSILSQEFPFPIQVLPISEEATGIADRWEYRDHHIEHRPGWSWAKELRRYQRKPRHIEAAFYVDDGQTRDLWGLMLGKMSDSRVVAALHYIERNPTSTRAVQFANAALRYLELFAAAAGCAVFAVNNPHPDLVEYYKSKGLGRAHVKGKKLIRLECDVALYRNGVALPNGIVHDHK